MKKPLLLGMAMGWLLTGNAQVITENAVIIDAAEDTTQVNTIQDIVLMQEKVSSDNITDAHYANVWSRKSYFNPGWVSSKLASRNPVFLANGKSADLSFKSKWGAQIELGHSYSLHRGTIANMVQINLDYTFIDLTVDHYEKDNNVFASFDPSQKWDGKPGTPAQNENNYNKTGIGYLPWGADKYDLTYGMSLGPSITVTPFTPLNKRGLDFIKLNVYYHIGYNVGLLLMDYKNADKTNNNNNNKDKSSGLSFDYLNWGHGLSSSFGLSISWKSIGIGWETRTTDLKYKPISTGDYGDFETKLRNTSSRIYLSIKY